MNDYTKPKSSLDLSTIENSQVDQPSILEGPIKVKKKTAIETFKDDFFSGDLKTIKEYAIKDILIPTLKRTFRVLVGDALDLLLFNEVKGNRSVFSDGPKPNKYTYTSYSNYYDGNVIRTKPVSKPVLPQKEDYRKWVYTEADARRVLTYLRNEIDKYDRVSVAKLYRVCRKYCDAADENYGWFDLSMADWHYDIDADGYILELPSPEPII